MQTEASGKFSVSAALVNGPASTTRTNAFIAARRSAAAEGMRRRRQGHHLLPI